MHAARKVELQEFIKQWQLEISDYGVINTAFVHPTYAFEHKRIPENNQRLEFLGDAVLGLIVGEYLYKKFLDLPEGELTKMRAVLVCESTLALKAREVSLGKYLLLGKGEEAGGGRDRSSILADCFEAVTGAIYLQCGLEQTRAFITSTILRDTDQIFATSFADAKTRLQELVQKKGEENVQYKILQEVGPDHDKRFEVGVYYKTKLLAQAWGKNKKEAEQKAAHHALESFQKI